MLKIQWYPVVGISSVVFAKTLAPNCTQLRDWNYTRSYFILLSIVSRTQIHWTRIASPAYPRPPDRKTRVKQKAEEKMSTNGKPKPNLVGLSNNETKFTEEDSRESENSLRISCILWKLDWKTDCIPFLGKKLNYTARSTINSWVDSVMLFCLTIAVAESYTFNVSSKCWHTVWWYFNIERSSRTKLYLCCSVLKIYHSTC